ncbi:LrgB family protein [Myceligenerans pegani]|uniref:LrgB family protein n=1 Tax=Myceligenerans pegani TaxID=2776917 RepID=A0ABR9N5E4_9MICO|nr:LrgB family protein [Myceligenerans sp. TRM 65318]MBE1878303.1 LrgB family protein [Myceligenerans sp. TRM 65318]MBE3020574.1 LrgB family protein [Myceligenerans sp. TRM 65318]
MSSPLLAVTLTVGVWVVATRASRLAPSVLNPVLTSTLVIIGVLLTLGVPTGDYQRAATPLTFLLAPAVVALAVPIRQNARRLLGMLPAIVVSAVAASAVGLGTAAATARVLGAPDFLVASVAPKHATSAVAATTSEALGGDASLSAVLAVLTGILGAVAGPPLLRLLRVSSPESRGLAMGLAAHAIGTSRAFDTSHRDGSSSALGMALAALAVPLLAVGLSLTGLLLPLPAPR